MRVLHGGGERRPAVDDAIQVQVRRLLDDALHLLQITIETCRVELERLLVVRRTRGHVRGAGDRPRSHGRCPTTKQAWPGAAIANQFLLERADMFSSAQLLPQAALWVHHQRSLFGRELR
jgi:hypothetical protein